MEYDEEKQNGVNCANYECRYSDGLYEQNCSAGDENDNPAIVGCRAYIPLSRCVLTSRASGTAKQPAGRYA